MTHLLVLKITQMHNNEKQETAQKVVWQN